MGPLLLALILAGPVTPTPAPSSASSPTPTPTPRPAGRLDLGSYGAPGGGLPKVGSLSTAPRFESSVDVQDKAPRDYNETMAVWWAHFDFTKPAIYGAGTAFRAPAPKGSIDVTPLVGWVADKVKDYKRNRQKVPTPVPSPTPTPKP